MTTLHKLGLQILIPLFLVTLASAETSAQPNILFILTDDQGYGDLGRHGHPFLKTPNLDKLSDESVRFDNFYVSPSCSPTRAALLTGMHELRNGVTHTMQPREHLLQSATMLKEAGYQWSLFASKKDPACENDLSASEPKLVENLSAAYEQWWQTVYPEMIAAGGDKGEPLKRGARPKH